MRTVWIISAVLLATAHETCAKEWKVFCMPDKHLDVGWAYLPQDALDQGYPGSVEDMQNLRSLRALFIRKMTASHPPAARYHWYFDAAWQLEQVNEALPDLMGDIRSLVNSGDFGYNPVYAHLHSMYHLSSFFPLKLKCSITSKCVHL